MLPARLLASLWPRRLLPAPGLSCSAADRGSPPAGGQASNVATYVANGDVALSVLMTAASTVAATVMTPTLTSLLAGAYIPVDGWVSWRRWPGARQLSLEGRGGPMWPPRPTTATHT